MISVYLREARILPAQLELTPGNSLPPPLPSVSTQHFFLSGDVLWQNSALKPLHKAVSCRYPLRLEFKEGNACWFEWIKMKLIRNLITKQFANNLKTWTSYFTPYLYLKLGQKKLRAEPAQPMGYPILIGVFLNPKPIFQSVSASLCRLWWWSVLPLQ